MDNIKMPFLPEETLRTQRVEVYLQDLKDRLKELQLRHKEVIQNSVDIIKEIDEVSSTLLLTHNNLDENKERSTRIKELIQEFEMNKEKNFSCEPKTIENQVDIRQILENFEKLNKSHVLAESLMLFCKAKESFEKIDYYFESRLKETSLNTTDYKKLNISEGIRDKIIKLSCKQPEAVPATSTKELNSNAFKNNDHLETTIKQSHKANEYNFEKDNDLTESPSFYTSCCSSVVSIPGFKTVEDISSMSSSKYSNSFTGYEGDNDDSEYDLFLAKKKKNTKLNTVE